MAAKLEPKLLRQIFRLLPRSQNARNAAVCRSWMEEALACVWTSVTASVFESLGKMTEKTSRGRSSWSFVRPLIPSDWTGLLKYADRVLEIDLRHGSRSLPLSESAWYEVAHSRPRLVIFPHLQSIIGGVKSMNGLFMSETIKSVDLMLDCYDTSLDVAVATSFVARFEHFMPHVSSLHIHGQGRINGLSKLFARLSGSLNLLKDVTAPAEFLNPFLFNSLRRSVFLETIAMDCNTNGQIGVSDDGHAHAADDMILELQSGAFPTLRHFALGTLSSENAVRIFSHPHFPTWRLATIRIQFAYGWQLPSVDVGAVVRVLAQQCFSLTELTICFAEWDRPTSMIETDECKRISIQDILPIFRIPSLTSLYIQHPHPILFEAGDLEKLVLAGSDLRTLWLNPWPRWNLSHDLISLDDVALFARHCHNLVRLGLSSDCVVKDVEAAIRFQSLEELFIGDTSFSLEDEEDDARYSQLSTTAVFLSRLLPPCCKLTSLENGSDGIAKSFYKECLRWKPSSSSRGWRILLATVGLLMEEKEAAFLEARKLRSEAQALEVEIARLTAGWL